MQYDPKLEVKQFRRIMLNVFEICPRRFRTNIMAEMQILEGLRDFGEYYSGLLNFLYRLQKGRLFRDASLQQKYTMEITLLWLETAYRHETGKPYEHRTLYALLMDDRAEYERNEEWRRRHPFLTEIGNFVGYYYIFEMLVFVLAIVMGLVVCTAIYRMLFL